MRTSLAAAVAVGLGGAALAITIQPSSHDFGPTLVPNGVALAQFTLTGTPGDSMYLSITGPDAAVFSLAGESAVFCLDADYRPTASCPIDMDFRPTTVGPKTATLVVTNRRGQRATASLRGEGVSAVGCRPVLVPCNYANLYSGSIQIFSVDSVSAEDHVVRFETDINLAVVNGVVTCTGTRRESEKIGYRGKFNSEMAGSGPIAGSGMLAVEFQREEGKPVYVLTYACPEPRMTRTSTDLNYGTSTSETFPGAPADWRNSERLADPQPSTGAGMTPLTGGFTSTRRDPANSAGGTTKSMWELRR